MTEIGDDSTAYVIETKPGMGEIAFDDLHKGLHDILHRGDLLKVNISVTSQLLEHRTLARPSKHQSDDALVNACSNLLYLVEHLGELEPRVSSHTLDKASESIDVL